MSLLLTIFLTLNAWAQFDFQIGVSPGQTEVKEATGPVRSTMDPYAAAMANELLSAKTTSFWEIIGISTSAAPIEFNQHVRRGFGRTELASLILMSEASKKPFKNLAKQRAEGQGKKLRALAQDLGLNFEEIASRAKGLRARTIARMKEKKLENKGDAGIRQSTTPRTTP